MTATADEPQWAPTPRTVQNHKRNKNSAVRSEVEIRHPVGVPCHVIGAGVVEVHRQVIILPLRHCMLVRPAHCSVQLTTSLNGGKTLLISCSIRLTQGLQSYLGATRSTVEESKVGATARRSVVMEGTIRPTGGQTHTGRPDSNLITRIARSQVGVRGLLRQVLHLG